MCYNTLRSILPSFKNTTNEQGALTFMVFVYGFAIKQGGLDRNLQNFLRKIRKIFFTLRCLYGVIIHRN